ncbi:MAG: M90 family metallopeptidase [Candidatus Bipolaricaulota bacterium]
MGSGVLGRWRRRRIVGRPFPAMWGQILSRTFPRYVRFSDEDRERIEKLLQIFLAEKRFEGAGGLAVDDVVRLTIAAQACWMTLHRDGDIFPDLSSVIVYPGEYVTRQRVRDEIGVVTEGFQPRLGETAARGAVVLAWDAALRGASDAHGGRSVVLHEFAHLLDAEVGGFDGAPRLPGPSVAEEWANLMSEEFALLQRQVERGEPTVLDPYAATRPAEFFAVASEALFLTPSGLARARPRLAAALARYYGWEIDALQASAWPGDEASEG